MRVGYLGLGTMGGALAGRMAQAGPLSVHDRDAARAASVTGAEVTAIASAAELGARCDAVLLCLPRSADVRAAIFGAGGLAEGLAEGALLIDQTSGDPAETRAMAAELAPRGVTLTDAPVSGGARGARDGSIAMMVGAAPGDYARAAPVLDRIGPNHTLCGPVGSGQVMKLVNNAISACNRAALLEGVALAVRSGIALDAVDRVLNAGGARSKASETMLPALAEGRAGSTFATALMLKDLNLAQALAAESGAPMSLAALARAMVQATAHANGPESNIDDLARTIGAQAGVALGPRADEDGA